MTRVIILIFVAIALVSSDEEVDKKKEDTKCSHQFRPPFLGGCICLPEGGPCPKSEPLETDEIAKKTEELESLVTALSPTSDEDRDDGCKRIFNIRGSRCVCWPSGKTVPCP